MQFAMELLEYQLMSQTFQLQYNHVSPLPQSVYRHCIQQQRKCIDVPSIIQYTTRTFIHLNDKILFDKETYHDIFRFSPKYQPSATDAHKNLHTNTKMRSPDIKITLHNRAALTQQYEVSQRMFCSVTQANSVSTLDFEKYCFHLRFVISICNSNTGLNIS